MMKEKTCQKIRSVVRITKYDSSDNVKYIPHTRHWIFEQDSEGGRIISQTLAFEIFLFQVQLLAN
jgi:hypothetical protein